MKKEESKVIAQKLQKIPNDTLALKHCRAGGTGSTLFGKQFRTVTAGKGCMEAYENRQGDRDASSFIGYNGSISAPVVFRYDNSFYSKMI